MNDTDLLKIWYSGQTIRKPVKGVRPKAPVPPQAFQKCPECGTRVRADHLPRHLRRVHAPGKTRRGHPQAPGTIRISDLAREMGVETSLIFAFLFSASDPFRFNPNALSKVIADRVRQNFRDMAERRRDQRIAELQARGSDCAHVQPRPIVNSAQIPVETFPFKLLPPGTWDLDYVIAYYREAASHFPAGIRDREIDWARLEAIVKSLRPAKYHVGQDQWTGYIVFEFLSTSRVLLECPVEGNAIYVLWGDWKKMVAHTKRYLWTRFPDNYRRIIHAGRWLQRTRKALKLR